MITKEFLQAKIAKFTAQYDKAIAKGDLDKAEQIAQAMHPYEMQLLNF